MPGPHPVSPFDTEPLYRPRSPGQGPHPCSSSLCPPRLRPISPSPLSLRFSYPSSFRTLVPSPVKSYISLHLLRPSHSFPAAGHQERLAPSLDGYRIPVCHLSGPLTTEASSHVCLSGKPRCYFHGNLVNQNLHLPDQLPASVHWKQPRPWEAPG